MDRCTEYRAGSALPDTWRCTISRTDRRNHRSQSLQYRGFWSICQEPSFLSTASSGNEMILILLPNKTQDTHIYRHIQKDSILSQFHIRLVLLPFWFAYALLDTCLITNYWFPCLSASSFPQQTQQRWTSVLGMCNYEYVPLSHLQFNRHHNNE